MDRELEHRFMDETNEGAREDFAGLETHKIEYVCWLEYQILKPKEDTINPKMKLSKEELARSGGSVKENYTPSEQALQEILKHKWSDSDKEVWESRKDNRIPDYYIGNNGYEARKVIDGFDLSYNVGTAVTYLLRAERKHDTPIECIQKAINHLEFELDKLKR